MYSAILAHEVDWEGFRTAARRLALARIAPEHVVWAVNEGCDLFAQAKLPDATGTLALPRALISLAQSVIQAREPGRFDLLYRLIWRISALHQRNLLEHITDPDIVRANRLAQAVRRDSHKMRAFLRFREINNDGVQRHVAWFEPSHFIVEANAIFFTARFTSMIWSILTPYRCMHWDGTELVFAPGAKRSDMPKDDDLAEYWNVYFAAIFNPARLKVAAMQSEMPRKYWANLPEAALIPDLIATATARNKAMINTPTLSPPRPTRRRATSK